MGCKGKKYACAQCVLASDTGKCTRCHSRKIRTNFFGTYGSCARCGGTEEEPGACEDCAGERNPCAGCCEANLLCTRCHGSTKKRGSCGRCEPDSKFSSL